MDPSRSHISLAGCQPYPFIHILSYTFIKIYKIPQLTLKSKVKSMFQTIKTNRAPLTVTLKSAIAPVVPFTAAVVTLRRTFHIDPCGPKRMRAADPTMIVGS